MTLSSQIVEPPVNPGGFNKPILQFLERMGFIIEQRAEAGMI